MGIPSKGVTVASALAGLVVFSQAPEFTQQYRQRLGGAVEELKIAVDDFDADASAVGLERQSALEQMKSSEVELTRNRGFSMDRLITRYEALAAQRFNMENAHPITRPLFIVRNPDTKLLEGAWQDFEPAVPVNQSGFVYGGIGMLLAILLARLGIGGVRRRRQARRDQILSDASGQKL